MNKLTRLTTLGLLLVSIGCTTRGPKNSKYQTKETSLVVSSQNANKSTTLKIMSWNIRDFGRDTMDYPAMLKLMNGYDIIAIQEVGLKDKAKVALKKLADKLSKMSGRKYCRGISNVPTDGDEKYAFIWVNASVFVENAKGKTIKSCTSKATVFSVTKHHQDKIIREPAVVKFYSRKTQRHFTIASIHLVPTKKKPQKEVPWLFKAMSKVSGPLLVLGDFNLDSVHKSFNAAKTTGFKAIFARTKTSLRRSKRELGKAYDNVFVRGLKWNKEKVHNLFQLFPSKSIKEVYWGVADHAPITAEFTF